MNELVTKNTFAFATAMCVSFLTCIANKRNKQKMYTLRYLNTQDKYEEISQYLLKQFPDKIKDFLYLEELVSQQNDWRRQRKQKPKTLKVLSSGECVITIPWTYNDTVYKIHIDHHNLVDPEGKPEKLLQASECSHFPSESYIMKMNLQCVSRDALIDFVDSAVERHNDDCNRYLEADNDTMSVYYYSDDYWSLLSKTPKRAIQTVYLKQGVKEDLLTKVQTFFSQEIRSDYLKYGIPYKSVHMIYGPPGTGKTSVIKSISSELDCDLFVLPVTKTMLDSNFVDAFNYINDKSDKNRIVVIEDIDTMFEERKEGDKNNGITMQGFLNCLDGFTCIEGTLVFLTANKPEVLDNAMIRSCRIDHKLELGYADKYQTQTMFEVFFPKQADKFAEFYKFVKNKQYTTAMLQEFLFYNRKSDDILKQKNQFQEIIEQNNTKHFELLKKEERMYT